MRTVLVADDHDDTRQLWRAMLEHAGWRVIEAARGDVALDLALTQQPDVLLLDLMMPGLSGTEVLRRVRGSGLRTPAILVTAALVREADPEFAAMLMKPVALDDIVAAVTRAADADA
jgi:CheY-like chemotaxis protein